VGLDITGQTLTATEGTWTGTEPITYAFQWELCNSAGASCAAISGAQSSSFVIPNGDAGHTLRVDVTAKNVAGSVEKASAVTGEVLGVGPKDTELPTVSGTATAGQSLTATSGKWSGTEPIVYEYEWLRCNTSGAECTTASAASVLGTSYTVAAADVGHKLRVKVIAKNIAGSGTAESAASATVTGVAPENVIAPLVAGVFTSGSTVTTTEGTWTGTEPITYEYKWSLCNSKDEACVTQGSTTKSFTIPAGSGNKTVKVTVTAKNVAGSKSKESLATTILL
jgi:hypothetical protein